MCASRRGASGEGGLNSVRRQLRIAHSDSDSGPRHVLAVVDRGGSAYVLE
jgi:hypothetical protein